MSKTNGQLFKDVLEETNTLVGLIYAFGKDTESTFLQTSAHKILDNLSILDAANDNMVHEAKND